MKPEATADDVKIRRNMRLDGFHGRAGFGRCPFESVGKIDEDLETLRSRCQR
jgi:hypothetical protein